MFKFLQRSTGAEPTLNSVTFDTEGYEPLGEPRPGEIRAWYTPEGDRVGLYYFALPPDLPKAPTLNDLRAFYVSSLKPSHGQLVELSARR